MIPNLTVGDLTIDCADAMRARGFYARLTGWEKTVAYGCPALKTGTGMTILFAEPDTAYIPPVWPEEEGREQKQAHLDFTADDLPSAVEQAVRLGALKAVARYGEHCVTMFDTEGHPFCLCKRQEKSEFESYFKKKGYAVIPNSSVNIDCPDTKKLREFYAALTGWDTAFHPAALVTGDGMVVHFMQADFEYIPPVWPEEEGRQQKHMHFNFQVDDLTAAVEEAVRLGGSKAARQYGADHFVTMLDPDGHPFCLCKRSGYMRMKKKKPKMILFDYGHTLLYEPGFDTLRGEEALYKYIISNKNNLTPKQANDFAQALFAEIGLVRETGLEMHERQFQRFLYEYLEIELSVSLPEAEKIFWDNTSAGAIMPNADRIIDYINANGIRSGVISNIGWSGTALEERLNRLLPRNTFEFVIASSEYMFRKPNVMLFELALKKAGLSCGDVWFCGDNIKADIEGSASAGIFPVWYEDETVENPWRGQYNQTLPECEHLHIHDWMELIDVLEESDASEGLR